MRMNRAEPFAQGGELVRRHDRRLPRHVGEPGPEARRARRTHREMGFPRAPVEGGGCTEGGVGQEAGSESRAEREAMKTSDPPKPRVIYVKSYVRRRNGHRESVRRHVRMNRHAQPKLPF